MWLSKARVSHQLKFIRLLLWPLSMSRGSPGGVRREITAKAQRKKRWSYVRASTPSALQDLRWESWHGLTLFLFLLMEWTVLTTRMWLPELAVRRLRPVFQRFLPTGSIFLCDSKREHFSSLLLFLQTILRKRNKKPKMKDILVVVCGVEWEKGVWF